MAGFVPNVDPMYLLQRKGTEENPYLPLKEDKVVYKSADKYTVTLSEIPSFNNKVKVKGTDGNSLTEIFDFNAPLSSTQFYVDYTSGVVYFHSSNEQKQFNFDYLGMGNINFPSSRIVMQGGTKTLQELAKDIENSRTNWLNPPLPTLNDVKATYPTPSIGDTIMTTSDGAVYRYDSKGWGMTQLQTDSALTDLQIKVAPLLDGTDAGTFTDEDDSPIKKIQHKRGLEEDLPDLKLAELGFTVDKEQLYVGTDSKNVRLLDEKDKESIEDTLLTNISSINNKVDIKSSGTVSVLEYGAKGDGVTDDLSSINSALAYGKTGQFVGNEMNTTVVIPPGKYKIGGAIRVYRNTRIIAYGAHIIRGSYVSLLTNQNGSLTESNLKDPFNNYSGHGNILIEGGIWDGNILNQPYARTGFNAFYFSNGTNITVKNLEIRDIVTCHGIDLNSSKNILIDNCKFLGYKDATISGDAWYPRNYVEAIQIANLIEGVDGKGYPTTNVTVTNCYFGESGTQGTQPWPVGVGNHGAIYDQYNGNIYVSGCTFEGMTYAGFRGFKFRNTKIIDNTFNNCNQDISFSNSSGNDSTTNKWDESTNSFVRVTSPQSGMGLVIRGNYFKDTIMNCLWVRGQVNGNTIAKFDGIVFEGNIFKRGTSTYTTSNLIDLTWCKNASIKDVVANNVYRGISCMNCNDINIVGGRIEDVLFEGIYFSDLSDDYMNKGHSANISIMNVSLNNIKYNGILLNYVRGGKIENNYLTNVANLDNDNRNGIMVAQSSTDIQLEGNTIRMGTGNKNKYGIMVTSGAFNCRIGHNDVEGSTAPISIFGDTNRAGFILYTSNGRKVVLAFNNSGEPVYTLI